MVTSSKSRAPKPPATLPASQRLVLQSLVPVAMNAATIQLDQFTSRLIEALFTQADQTVRQNESAICLNAYNHLKKNRARFDRGVSNRLSELLLDEVHAICAGKKIGTSDDEADFSLVSIEEMEDKVLIGNLSQAIVYDHSDKITALNIRVSNVMQRESITLEQNPFRPALFLQAVYETWRGFDPATESHQVVLRLLRPDVFLRLDTIYKDLNDALIARGVVPNLRAAYRERKLSKNRRGTGGDSGHHEKLESLLRTSSPSGQGGSYQGDAANITGQMVGQALLGYLSNLQMQMQAPVAGDSQSIPTSADTLRQIRRQAPHGAMTQVDENTIELLAKVFDYVFREQAVADQIKRLIGHLQIPLLKATLLDKEFFFQEDHPARCLIDALAKSSLALNHRKGQDDPLYKMIERIVERVQKEFDQQIELFSRVVDDLDSFFEEEQKVASKELAAPIAAAMRQERMAQSRKKAEKDVNKRIETGEVASFLETFLENQWTEALTLAYSVELTKPEALEKALKGMDLLIWSLQPKTSPEDRKSLLTHLPALLSLVNAWLNVIKWDGAERVKFFTQLAERHAAIVRVQTELTPCYHIEAAVTVAERASEHLFKMREKELHEQPNDQFFRQVGELEVDDWIEFTRSNDEKVSFRLTWVSPKRSRYVFSNRQGDTPLAFAAEDLAHSLRTGRANLIPLVPIVERALNVALEEMRV